MSRDKYNQKCLQMLNTNQFLKLSKLLIKTADREVQNVLRKSKSELSLNKYKKLYPTESSPGTTYWTKNTEAI